MWNRIKSIFSWFWDKLFFWRKYVSEDPANHWPYGYKLEGKVYYFPDKEQLSLESRMSRKFRAMKDD